MAIDKKRREIKMQITTYGKVIGLIGYIATLIMCIGGGAEFWQSLLGSSLFGIYILLLNTEEVTENREGKE